METPSPKTEPQSADPAKPTTLTVPGRKVSNPVRRRTFLQRILCALSGFGLLGAFYPVLRYIEPPPESEGANRVEIDAAELPPGASRTILYRGRPAVVVNSAQGYIAYGGVCSHLGCIIKWSPAEQVFICPCHGGKFNVKGVVLGGPVPRPLTAIPVSVAGNRVIVGA